ncbi:hypothetical protein HFP51_07240 [Parasphingopyxis sp. CP4]|uniref:hypothetical protein n=1 Tax=Parasphingopyxis sp. CP4 TaxID=2724527 RepID=UPI0015A0D338|nr:hypothetical protein [Parasphingopyxis sp. CP4]QLC21993.1 hypothetical protein HFP51_07240 [Parasphingopyxis sp. CP4]
MRSFGHFACFDWSGQAVAKPKGIALAIARAGVQAPALVASDTQWSRQQALEWLEDQAGAQTDMLIGFDFSAALPFADRGGYFPTWSKTPGSAKTLWETLDRICADDEHLAAIGACGHPALAPYFRYQEGRETITGDQFEAGLGRLRVTEHRCRTQKQGNAVSCFNLVGAAQVGKSSLTGMRVLHRLSGKIPVWPFDPIPETGPMLVEIYTGLAARAAGLSGPTKIRDAASLDRALDALGTQRHSPLPAYDDHRTDALLTAAWLRMAASDAALWQPAGLTEQLAQQEGWTFGVR